MSLLEVKYLGSSVLKRKAKAIGVIDQEIITLAQDMLETMYTYNGVGLAAPQVGISKQLVVIDCGEKYQKEPYVLINPKIIDSKGSQLGEEGCLSLPGLYLEVLRSDYVAVESMDLSGNKVVLEGRQLLARCMQHEIDHLTGLVFTELVEDQELVKKELPILKERISKILSGEIPAFEEVSEDDEEYDEDEEYEDDEEYEEEEFEEEEIDSEKDKK